MQKVIPPDVWPFNKSYYDISIPDLLCAKCVKKPLCMLNNLDIGCMNFIVDEKLIKNGVEIISFNEEITMGLTALTVKDLLEKNLL